MLPGRRIRLGLAVAPHRVVAVTVRRTLRGLRPDRVLRRGLERGPGPDGWPELTEALAGLRDELPGDPDRPLRLHVALLPPLARTKVTSLPSAGREALRRLVGREVGRHFLDPPDEPVADAAPVVRSLAARNDRPCVAGCADEAVVRALLASVREAGAETGLILPAAWCLAEGAPALEPELRRGERRLRLGGPNGRRDVLLGDGVLRSVRPVVPDEDERPAEGNVEGAEDALDTTVLAAYGALVAPEDGPALLPEDAWRTWRRRGRTRAALAAAVALLLAGAGALLHLWGLDREIRAVEARRARLAEPVERSQAAREAALRLREALSSVDSVRPRPPAWTRVLSQVGEHLPSSAYLETLDDTGEGVRITGSARSPSALVPRLEEAPVVESARLESTTRRRQGRDGQRFQIVLSLARPGAP